MSVESRRRDPFCLLVFREPFSSACSLFINGHMFEVGVRSLLVREKRKGRDERAEEKNRKGKTAAWKTRDGRQPVCHHLDEEARASLPRFLRARGGKDTREYAMRNTVIVRLVNATWRRNRTMASKKSLCPPGKSFSRVMKILLGRDE